MSRKAVSLNNIPVRLGDRSACRFANLNPQQTATPKHDSQHCYQNEGILQPHIRNHWIDCVSECESWGFVSDLNETDISVKPFHSNLPMVLRIKMTLTIDSPASSF